MKAVSHESNNRVFGAPKGWDHHSAPCDNLPVTDDTLSGHVCVTSYWQPTLEELAILNGGGLVRLWIIGTGMPPVALSVEARE